MCEGPVLITGATGFIGGRLAEKLVVGGDTDVRVGVRKFSSAANLARLPVDFRATGSGDLEEYARAVDGCRTVFHCAHDFSRPEANLSMARALIAACAIKDVPRLVYLSSFSAYIPLGDSPLEVTEQVVWRRTTWEYAATKRAVTNLLLEEGSRLGVGVTVIEPPCVYGPYSFPFTIYPVHELRTTRVVVPHDDEGVCNLVYIDDLVDAMLAAATLDLAVGQRFIVNGEDRLTWRELYETYAEAIGEGEIIPMRREEAQRLGARRLGVDDRSTAAARRVLADPQCLLSSRSLVPAKRMARRVMGKRLWARARALAPRPFNVPEPGVFDFRWTRYYACSEKARRLLGYSPRYRADEGLGLSVEFIRWARL